ncbi:MAG TPA: DUF805 domain-containing protein [Burkholderiaceae bacterium]
MSLVPELPTRPDDDLRTLLLGLQGRVPRKTFWLWGVLALVLAQMVAYALLGIAGASERFAEGASALLVVWPSFAITVKRWHDRGKSAWWVLINLVPVVGSVWTLIECGLLRGTVGANRYGPDPLAGIDRPQSL